MQIESMGTDHSYYSEDVAENLCTYYTCGPGNDCRMYRSPKQCTSSSPFIARTRVAANPPMNTAFATLACPVGNRITGITFASFGTPTGDCDEGFAVSADACAVDLKGLART